MIFRTSKLFITAQKIKNKSIIKEIDEFPIIFTGNLTDCVGINEFEGICKFFNIKDRTILQLCKDILGSYISTKPNVIRYIKNNKEFINESNKLIKLEKETKHDDSESEVESDDESDIYSIDSDDDNTKKLNKIEDDLNDDIV